MKINSTIFLCRFKTFITAIWLMMLVSCVPLEQSSTLAPTPFNSSIPNGQFLFVFIEDDDYTCLDGLCGCPISQAPPMPFEFQGDKLLLSPYWFDPEEPNSTTSKEIAASNILYGDHSQWDAHLKLSSTFPIKTLTKKLLIVGVNLHGDIQLQDDHQYVVIPVGSTYHVEEPERQSWKCKVLHKYELTNYGFIKDSNVELY